MKAGLFFGSFNPVHIGHLIIASTILNETDLSLIRFVVSPQNPFKPSATLLNEQHRLQLLRAAIENDARLQADNTEFQLPKPSYTADTLLHLKQKSPATEFTIIMGSDSWNNIKNWKNPYYILDNYNIIIYPRPGFDAKDLTQKAKLIHAPFLDISASGIRQWIKERKSIRYLVPEAVRELIETQNYYGNSRENPTQ